MLKQLLNTCAITVAMVALAACYPNEHHHAMAPGKYESTKSTTDSYGTTTETKDSTEVDVDDNGDRKIVKKTKTTQDPKGLFNKTTVNQSKEVIKEDSDGDNY